MSAVVTTAYAAVFPTEKSVRGVYGLTGGTLVSGALLLIADPTHIGRVCMSGAIFLICISIGLAVAKKRLANAIA